MTARAIIIGPAKIPDCSLRTERRSSSPAARRQGLLPIPRRIPNEFYPTPPSAVRALLSVEAFAGPIWEPACGEGAIANVLTAAGHTVVSTDLCDYGFGEANLDFLETNANRGVHIVTNPPYGSGLADAFITKALSFTRRTGGKTAMLLNLASLCHPSRKAFWLRHTPARIYAIDGVVCWPTHRYGPAPQAFTRHRYCWVVWEAEPGKATSFGWLSAGDFDRSD